MTPSNFAVVFILLLVVTVQGYPNGAPDNAEICNTLKPKHYQIKGNTSSGLWEPNLSQPLNYSIHVSRMSVSSGQAVEVLLQADQSYFEGFILQARSASNTLDVSKRYGTFKPLDEDAKLICSGAGITHSKHYKWPNITFSWTAPKDTQDKIKFIATVVTGYKTYFMNVESDVVELSGSSTGDILSSVNILTFTVLQAFMLTILM
ncbi:ferric-chelate reductase 1 [Biomphalaria glabrata]